MPSLLIWLANKFMFLNKIGVVILSYLLGFALAMTGILPDNFIDYQNLLTTIIIPISIPLLLFSTDINAIKKLTDNFVKALLIALFSIITSIISGYYLFMHNEPNAYKIAGLLTAVYTGGTPNLASIKAALNVDSSIYIMVHSTDLIIGGIYLLFFITVAQKLLNKFLPKYNNSHSNISYQGNYLETIDIVSDFSSTKRRTSIIAISLSVLVFATGGGISLLFPQEYSTAIAILSITTFSILLSLYKPINNIKQSFSLGMYLILVFSMIIASMINIQAIGFDTLNLLYYVSWAMFGTFTLQLILSKIFGIDTDITIITATALSMSPPFVPVVAGALNNRDIIFPGIIIGIIGYILGNYLGVIIAFVLM